MTIYEFMVLSDDDKFIAFLKSTLIGMVIQNGEDWECGQINDFYVEYRVVDGDKYVEMKCHRNPKLIMKYLDDRPIDINSLL